MKPDPLFSCELVGVCIARDYIITPSQPIAFYSAQRLVTQGSTGLVLQAKRSWVGPRKVILKQKHVV